MWEGKHKSLDNKNKGKTKMLNGGEEEVEEDARGTEVNEKQGEGI